MQRTDHDGCQVRRTGGQEPLNLLRVEVAQPARGLRKFLDAAEWIHVQVAPRDGLGEHRLARQRATHSLSVEASTRIRARGRAPSTAAKRSGSVRIRCSMISPPSARMQIWLSLSRNLARLGD